MRKYSHETAVVIQQTQDYYLEDAPFHPFQAYPEYPFGAFVSLDPNPAYAGVREALRLLGLDEGHYGGADWNPLGGLIAPGDTVLLKPNFIREAHTLKADEWEQVITHGSVIRAVLDYAFFALRGRGKVVIADGPQTDSDFEMIRQRTGLDKVIEFYKGRGIEIQLMDLRRDRWYQKGDVIYERISLPGDPAGYTTVDLGDKSEFASYTLSGRYYGADYDMEETASFHSHGRHAYVICRSAMEADVVINLPKLKTHKKTGVTLSLKNMVGINGYRNCLPHHTIGTPSERGDEFPLSDTAHKIQSQAIVSFKRLLVALGGSSGGWARFVKRVGRLVFGDTTQVVRSGNWHGNDTAWRMVLDLNKVLFHFDSAGKLRKEPVRYMTIVDGIIAGDGNGPMEPDAKPAGLIVAGCNPVTVDTVCTVLMGFDYHKVPVVARAWEIHALPLVNFGLQELRCVSNIPEWNGSINDLERASSLGFKPHFGWTGHVERRASANRS